MQLFKFMRGGKLALTDDESGITLPGTGWMFQKSLELEKGRPRIGAPYDEVVNAIGDKGYFEWSAPEASDA